MGPYPITYTELLPMLTENHLVILVHLAPLKPLFPKWYNVNARCNYHVGIPSHLTEDCIAFKYMVQGLVMVGVLKFKNINRSNGIESLFRPKVELKR